MGILINKANYIYSEVNKERVYQNCTLINDLDLFLNQFGFKRVVTKWVRGAGWGDALYMKSPKSNYSIIGQYLTLKFLYFDLRDIVKSKLNKS